MENALHDQYSGRNIGIPFIVVNTAVFASSVYLLYASLGSAAFSLTGVSLSIPPLVLFPLSTALILLVHARPKIKFAPRVLLNAICLLFGALAFLSHAFQEFLLYSKTPTAEVKTVGNVLQISNGKLDLHALIKINNVLKNKREKLEIVSLNFLGGNNDFTNAAIYLMKKDGIHQAVINDGGNCISSCTGIWFAFDDRKIEPTGYLNFHNTIIAGSLPDISSADLYAWYSGHIPKPFIEAFSAIGKDDGMCRISGAKIVELGFDKDNLTTDLTPAQILEKCHLRKHAT